MAKRFYKHRGLGKKLKGGVIAHIWHILLAAVVIACISTIVLFTMKVGANASPGALWDWGYNGYGQLGTGNTNGSSTPTLVNGFSQVLTSSAGCYHSLTIKPDDTVWSWGDNGFGQLGIGSDSDTSSPTQINGLKAIAVAGGCYHSLAVKPDGTVWAWGNDGLWQLGTGNPPDTCRGFGGGGIACSKNPIQVNGLTNITAVAAGVTISVALKSDGTVYDWGGNFPHSPMQVSGLSNIVAIAAGSYHALALKSDGTIWAWGTNLYGVLGNGNDNGADYGPTQILSLSNVAGIGAGGWHSLAVKSDGTVYAWGRNYEGEIGTGSTSPDVTSPSLVRGVTGAKMVAGGLLSSFALKSDGTVQGWGYNGDGELGGGSAASVNPIPVVIPGLANVVNITPGSYHVLAVIGTVPAAPANLSIPSPTQYPALSWSASGGATSYNIYRNGVKVGSSTTTTFSDSSAPEGVESYYVTAVNSGGESSPSNTVKVLVDRTPPMVSTVTLTPNPIRVNTTTTLSATVTDALSGVFKVEYYTGSDPGQGNG
ncbi:MAG: hypothetical protein KGL95_15230, partial [Patescibacteria group bacterium]|nr:hypothetical protein [Patescibacteria group bacterium]